MNISGIEKLKVQLTAVQIEKLSKAANRHYIASNMTFTVQTVNETVIEIDTIQGETKSGKYVSEATLISRTQEVFGKYFPEAMLEVNPITYVPSLPSIVTTEWLEQKMLQKGVRIKQIAFDTGIDRESISDWVTGKRSMSQLVKAMLFFYLSK